MEGGKEGRREMKRGRVLLYVPQAERELDCLLPVVSCGWFQVFLTERDSLHTADIFHHHPVGERIS